MKIKVPIYKIEKVLQEENTFDLPDVETYFFETGVRKSIRMTPIWSTWKHEQGEKEEIHSYDITVVYLDFMNAIHFTNVAVHNIPNLYREKQPMRRDKEAVDVIQSLFDGYLDKRTKDQFNTDLKIALQSYKISE